MMTSTVALAPLCRANVAILSQKLALMDILVDRHGSSEASIFFRKVCPLVGASVGQHFRHSMDHIELAARAADLLLKTKSACTDDRPVELHYDLRVRGGTLETDMGEARKRISFVKQVLNELAAATSIVANEGMIADTRGDSILKHPVFADFMLSADEETESRMPSTVGRELGFAAHHAIHHMAMVRIIATTTLGLKQGDLPADFGKAPSTVQNDKGTKN